MNMSGQVCCIVLQCVAVCCSVLQCVAVYYSMLQYVAVYCSVLQCCQRVVILSHVFEYKFCPSNLTGMSFKKNCVHTT